MTHLPKVNVFDRYTKLTALYFTFSTKSAIRGFS